MCLVVAGAVDPRTQSERRSFVAIVAYTFEPVRYFGSFDRVGVER